VFDLAAPTASALKQSIATGGTTRVDEMALTEDGKLLLAVNNAEDPPYGTLFTANGDAATSHVSIITKVSIDPTIVPPGFGLGFEQSTMGPPDPAVLCLPADHRQQPDRLQLRPTVGRDHLQRRNGGD
jgi:hypothetical protein